MKKKTLQSPGEDQAQAHSDIQSEAPPSSPIEQARADTASPDSSIRTSNAEIDVHFSPETEPPEVITDRAAKNPAKRRRDRNAAENTTSGTNDEPAKTGPRQPREHRVPIWRQNYRTFEQHEAVMVKRGIRLDLVFHVNQCLEQSFDTYLKGILPEDLIQQPKQSKAGGGK